MKLLLIRPNSDSHVIMPSTSFGYLMVYLRESKFLETKFVDCLKARYDHKRLRQLIRDEQPDVVGLTAMSLEIDEAVKYCSIIKSVNRKIITMLGGSHVSNDQNLLKDKNIDFVFRGEAEIGFSQFINELRNEKRDFSKIKGLGYKEGNKLLFNELGFVEDLDALPTPDYDFVRFMDYPQMYFMKKYPSAPIMTSRGCPFNCTFCARNNISGKKFRMRSPDGIIRELKHLKKKYGIKEFQVWDDNFAINKERVMKFCDLLIKEKMNLGWNFPNGLGIKTLDEELLKKMRQAGCYSIAVGIESGSEKIQKDMRKNLDLEKVKETVMLADRIGIDVEGFFIIGYPTETREDILKTIKFSKELPFKRASFSLFQPLVGSEIYDILKKQGKIKSNRCTYFKVHVLPQGFRSFKEIKNLQRRALLEFYLRPRIFFKFMLENMSLNQIKEISLMVKQYIFSG